MSETPASAAASTASGPLEPPPFLAFLRRGMAAGGFSTDDTLAALLPLFSQVAEAHQRGEIAPLDGIAKLRVQETKLTVDLADTGPPRKNLSRIESLQRPISAKGVEVVGESHRTTDVDAGRMEHRDLWVGDAGAELTRPVYLPGYISWNIALDTTTQSPMFFRSASCSRAALAGWTSRTPRMSRTSPGIATISSR